MYLASDKPLREIKNPHEKLLSVNEAQALGLEVPEYLQNGSISMDKSGVILWVDEAADADDDFAVLLTEKQEDMFTEKKYCAYIEWNACTKGRAEQIAAYIKEHLEEADEIEIWKLWLGSSYPLPEIRKVNITAGELNAAVIEKISALDPWEKTSAGKQPALPRDWGYDENELETSTQYCYTIIKNKSKIN